MFGDGDRFLYCPANQLGQLRNNLDPMLTYEGDNNVILLQASNYLVGLFEEKQKGVCMCACVCMVCVCMYILYVHFPMWW